MNIRTIATMAVAAVLGLVAIIFLNGYLGGLRKAQPTGQPTGTVPVVVAAAPILRGTTLQPLLLKVVNYPATSVPAGASNAVGPLVGAAGAQRLALHDLTMDEPVLLGDLSGPGGRFTLSSTLTPGMQAVSVKANDVAGVGGFVLPGDRVDVLLTRTVGTGVDVRNSVAQIIADNVRVMGVDQSDNQSQDKPTVARSITVEVTPAQAQAIALGQQIGALSLSLRHIADSDVIAKRATTTNDLGFAGARAPAPRPAAAPAREHVASTQADAAVPLFGPGVVRVTRGSETTGYRIWGG
jgi:pilus assembly protein CpaB